MAKRQTCPHCKRPIAWEHECDWVRGLILHVKCAQQVKRAERLARLELEKAGQLTLSL